MTAPDRRERLQLVAWARGRSVPKRVGRGDRGPLLEILRSAASPAAVARAKRILEA